MAEFLQNGNVVRLICYSTTSYLCLVEGDVNGKGSEINRFIVHVQSPGVVALQSYDNPNNFLAIYDGKLIGTGQGGPYCYFKVHPSPRGPQVNKISLESLQYPSQHVGILPTGAPKLPANTRTGQHGSFSVEIVQTAAQVQGSTPVVGIAAPPPQNPNYQPHPNLQQGQVPGQLAQHPSQPMPQPYPPIQPANQYTPTPDPPPPYHSSARDDNYSDSKPPLPPPQPYGGYSAPSYPPQPPAQPSQPVQYNPCPLLPLHQAAGPTHVPSAHPVQPLGPSPPAPVHPVPPYLPVPTAASVQPVGPSANDTPWVISTCSTQKDPSVVRQGKSHAALSLHHGFIVRLRCFSTGKYLRIMPNGSVNGEGGEGELTKFVVVTRGPGVVALQWNKDPRRYLGIYKGVVKHGSGHCPQCSFIVQESRHAGDHISLESLTHPGHHLGILPSGEPKAPPNTRRGPHGSFYPAYVDEKPMLTKSAIRSKAYWLLNHGNVVVLTSCANQKNLRIHGDGRVDCSGGWGEWTKFIVETRGAGVFALRSWKTQKWYLNINGGGNLSVGTGGAWCEFQAKDPSPQSSQAGAAIICFSYVPQPDYHIGVLHTGELKPPSQTRNGPHGQFIVTVVDKVEY